MEAVIWTDVMPFCVLVFGMILILAVIVYAFGGHVGRIWSLAAKGGHTTMLDANLFSFSLKTEVTLLALIIGGVVTNVATYGSDQIIVQRYLTTGSTREMAKAVMFSRAALHHERAEPGRGRPDHRRDFRSHDVDAVLRPELADDRVHG
jgi:Na+/proline symporter